MQTPNTALNRTRADSARWLARRVCRAWHVTMSVGVNLKKHGVSFADAEGEQRFVTVGLGSAGEVLVVVWTERYDECRLISARRPTRKERKQYED